MPPVQLARLRPQVNALMAHYQDREYFRKTLLLLLEKYSEKKSATNTWLQDDHNIPAYRVPLIVMNEPGIRPADPGENPSAGMYPAGRNALGANALRTQEISHLPARQAGKPLSGAIRPAYERLDLRRPGPEPDPRDHRAERPEAGDRDIQPVDKPGAELDQFQRERPAKDRHPRGGAAGGRPRLPESARWYLS